MVVSNANFSFHDKDNIYYKLPKLPHSVMYSGHPFFNINSKDAFLMIVHMIKLLDDSLIISFAFHHMLCDAHGMIRVINALGNATRFGNVGIHKNATDRSILVGDGSKIKPDIDYGVKMYDSHYLTEIYKTC